MGQELTAKSFRSGNSIAVRLPAHLGVEAGERFRVVRHGDGSMTMFPEHRAKNVFMALAGAMSEGWMEGGRQDSDQEARDWSRDPGRYRL